MIKKTILSLLAVVSFTTANADTKMVIHQKENSAIDVLLKTKPVVTYEGTDLVVTADGATLRYPLSSLEKITFDETTTAIKCMTIISQDAGQSKVYDLNGRLVMTVDEGMSIETSSLPQGMYIVKNNKNSYKIQKK